jgi:predicted house-cleaning noncanonical NTP pyrophosphatase (MazG superfamily)
MKLVRDKIPEIIRARGDWCSVRLCKDHDEYVWLLRRKLDEEVGECHYKAHSSEELEEMADVLEVLYALAAARGWSPEDIEAARQKKSAANGGFVDRIVLEEWSSRSGYSGGKKADE